MKRSRHSGRRRDVLNVGGFIHNAHNPDAALPRWLRLFRSALKRVSFDIRFWVSSRVW